MSPVPRDVMAAEVRAVIERHGEWDGPHEFVTLRWDGEHLIPGMVGVIIADIDPAQYPKLLASLAAKHISEHPDELPCAYLLKIEGFGVAAPATLKHARAHPWPGNVPLDCPAHKLDTSAITEPGRPTRLLISLDVGYHNSGWFANSDYESCMHLSVSWPRPDVPRAYRARPDIGMPRAYAGMDLETPADDEVRAWGLVFFGPEHAPKTWFEPAASVFDPYHIRPWADGSSPRKVTEGRLGADVR